MMEFSTLNIILASLLLLCTIGLFVSFRLRSMLRGYACASFFFAALTASVGYMLDLPHLLLFAAATFLIKVVVIPFVIMRTVRRTDMPLRLQSYLRPAPSYFLVALIVVFTLFNLQREPLFLSEVPAYFFHIGVSIVLIGFVMMIVRRDIISQMLGFLVMENGISMFSVSTVGELPILIELGIFLAVMIGVLLMSHLFQRVHEVHGTSDSRLLRELVD